MPGDASPFPYMRWAKAYLDFAEPLSLGMSGLPRPEGTELEGVGEPLLPDGRDPELVLRTAVADRYGVPLEGVYVTAGSSHGNFLAYLAFARGGRVAAETPTYEALHRLGAAVGAEVRPFRRDETREWRIDADALAEAAVPGTRLLAVTDLHNPSGARLHPEDLDLLVAVADARDAVVLVDEVYLDLDPADRPTSARRDPRVLVTNSLTKSHGMWDLRAGWLLGAPERVAEVEAWDDLVCPRLPPAPMAHALAYLPHAAARLERVRKRCAEATDQVDAWVRGRADVAWVRPAAGFTGFLRLGTPAAPLDGDVVAARAFALAGVRVVPGSFFQVPEGIRISYFLDEAPLARALEGLGRALDEVAGGRTAPAAS